MAEIVGVGGVCLDRIVAIPRMPGWDETEYISGYVMQQGGMVATAMVAVARLGGGAEFIGGIAGDDAGQYLTEGFAAAQVETSRMRVFSSGHTAFSFVLVHGSSGKRTIIHHRGVQVQQDLGGEPIALDGVRFLHLDGYWFETALRTARAAKKRGIIVTLDPSSLLLRHPQAVELFHLVDYLMPGAAFARRWTEETDLEAAAAHLLQYGGRAVIITQGEKGCVLHTGRECAHIPAFQVSVVDTTGAGDTFHGAFIAGLSRGYPVRQAVQFASAVAALKCTKLGGQSGIPTFHETLAFLASRGISLSSPLTSGRDL